MHGHFSFTGIHTDIGIFNANFQMNTKFKITELDVELERISGLSTGHIIHANTDWQTKSHADLTLIMGKLLL